ncbi:SDR family NAD(P)-dependent oxidoreductase [Rivularia sp. UHCC 0363]|uniref:SDR family NAD(P)-dependent oxidoreductase n=1 Tax=Rivularia sp. UHCC 0363 TaxID=3110244 RepID=UPI002B209FF4|nr:SDR family NAD(P)-dependent oxidoreductase [Rivularia sp. UHCC 0363]MEA5598931.1 SDR family NAD(P)-dependent oxidoreductase [Rivularia sp. UHCC 0363]
MQSVVVTGVSTGIGWGTLKVLNSKGIHIFGSVRKPEDAERLTNEFGNGFTPLIFDVTDEKSVREAADRVSHQISGNNLLGLVNNAGIAIGGPLMHQPIAEFSKQIEVNLIGQLIVTQAFLPLLGTNSALIGKPGRIINISSVGGKIAMPFLGAYNASKFGLEGFSAALRRELMVYGIDVIIIGPGSVVTPIWDKAEQIDFSPYENTKFAIPSKKFMDYALEKARSGYSPEDVGNLIWKALTTEKPKVRYAIVPNHFFDWIVARLLPQRVLDHILAKQFGLGTEK